MPVGVQLSDLRRDLRAETGTSLNPAQGVQAQATLDVVIDRQQRELWDAYNWPHLKFVVDTPLQKNLAVYNYPAGMPFDQILHIYVATSPSADWQRLDYGIDGYMIRASGPQVGTPTRWSNQVSVDTSGAQPVTNPTGKILITPTPNSSTMIMRIEGMAPLTPLVNDTDKCIIDSKAIVLFAAAEILANQKSEGASMKLQKAQNHLRRLLQDQGADKRWNYNMGGRHRFGNDPDRRRAVPYIDYIPS
ncbi:hypothetical protein QIH85_24060 [Bradyrhizobium japonicum]|uniref:hypothetical protein n=1 Tax=Bradyrhizobium japonicum TaxID=375 RepID=UPI002714E113|nr:hypothetical protein [Bradyrhizobium japonicum]WLB24959.1 hypothetical protein QIH85_24060 [Bradyrhizobium japonicum]